MSDLSSHVSLPISHSPHGQPRDSNLFMVETVASVVKIAASIVKTTISMVKIAGEPERRTARNQRSTDHTESGPVSEVQYSYKQLHDGQIRLLMLTPGDSPANLQGVIYHTSLESAGLYEALSYLWGATDERPHTLRTPDGVVLLTLSLHSALQQLREKGKPVILWVDAVCINQKDNAEKVKQIHLMSQIFKKASYVIAYIGEEADESHLAFETLLQIKMKAENPKTHLGSHSPWGERHIPPSEDTAWEAIRALFARHYFRRVWIIAEIVLAIRIRVVCGKCSVGWSDLVKAIETCKKNIMHAPDKIFSFRENFDIIWVLEEQRECRAKNKQWDLLKLLQLFEHAKATLQRDRLFALLVLAAESSYPNAELKDPKFEVDYDASFEVIVRRYAAAFVKQGRGMDLLYRAKLGSQPDRFPSWIPDWTTPNRHSLYEWSSQGGCYRAAKDTKTQLDLKPSSDELTIQGLLVDEVRSVSQSANELAYFWSYFLEVAQMVDSLGKYPTGEHLSDLKWKVPIAGATQALGNKGSSDLRLYYEALDRMCALARKASGEDPVAFGDAEAILDEAGLSSQYKLLWEKCHVYFHILLTGNRDFTLSGWRFLVTERGYAGVAPNSVRAGDTICIFNGGAVPFLLRKSRKRDGAYHLLGGCYVHGFMSGEEMGRSNAQVEEIRLH
jgi:Heterokaryon incompatibility protein (HET)